MNRTNIEFVNHASVLISHGEINILSDPWYSGAVFHQGWRLLYENSYDKINDILKKTTHIYISHEHPDHFQPAFFLDKGVIKILTERKIKIVFMTEKKSTKSQSNDSNITPVRSEAMLNKPRGNIGGGSRLLLFFLGFINLIGLFVLGLWFFNTSYYQQQTGPGGISGPS